MEIKYAGKVILAVAGAVTGLVCRTADYVSEKVGEFLCKHYILAIAIMIICFILGAYYE